jgi:hypothetical protein
MQPPTAPPNSRGVSAGPLDDHEAGPEGQESRPHRGNRCRTGDGRGARRAVQVSADRVAGSSGAWCGSASGPEPGGGGGALGCRVRRGDGCGQFRVPCAGRQTVRCQAPGRRRCRGRDAGAEMPGPRCRRRAATLEAANWDPQAGSRPRPTGTGSRAVGRYLRGPRPRLPGHGAPPAVARALRSPSARPHSRTLRMAVIASAGAAVRRPRLLRRLRPRPRCGG